MESTDHWTPAILSDGIIRPKRSSSAMNLRPVERPQSHMSDSVGVVQGSLQRYQRSLKLLGLVGERSTESPFIRPQTRSAKPKVNTRLNRRTISTEDLKTALLHQETSDVDEAPSRGLLSRAVYEAWYFTKAEQCRALEEAKKERDKVVKWREEAERQERLHRGKMSFEDWLRRKKEQQEKKRTEEKNPKSQNRLPAKRTVSREAAEAAYEKWKKEKEEKDSRQVQVKSSSEEKLKMDQEKKKSDAEKAFEAWKARRDEELKKKKEEEKRENQLKEETLKRVKESKEKDAEACFRSWSITKAEELRKKEALARKKTRNGEETKEKERKYEAQQAFASWLDGVLEKETMT